MDRRGDPGECSGDYVFYIEQSVYRVVPESVQIRVCRVLTVRKTDRKNDRSIRMAAGRMDEMSKREKAYAACCIAFFTLLTMLGSAHNYIVSAPLYGFYLFSVYRKGNQRRGPSCTRVYLTPKGPFCSS